MITHNRRKRKAYYAEQNMLMYQHLMIAKEAAAKGIASEEQILLLNKERAAEEAQEAKKNRKTLWKSAKSVFSTAGLKKVDTASAVDNLVKGTGDGTNMEQPTKQKGVMETIEEKRREGEKRLQDMGIKQGPLDQVAADATSKPRSGGWTSWLR